MAQAPSLAMVNIVSRREQEAARQAANRARAQAEREKIRDRSRVIEAQRASTTAPLTGRMDLLDRQCQRAIAMHLPQEQIPSPPKKGARAPAYLRPIFRRDEQSRKRACPEVYGQPAKKPKTSALFGKEEPQQEARKVLKQELNIKEVTRATSSIAQARTSRILTPFEQWQHDEFNAGRGMAGGGSGPAEGPALLATPPPTPPKVNAVPVQRRN